MKPKNVMILHNGMVVAFDSRGKQIPELQGNIFESIAALADADLSELVSFEVDDIRIDMLREAQRYYRERSFKKGIENDTNN